MLIGALLHTCELQPKSLKVVEWGCARRGEHHVANIADALYEVVSCCASNLCHVKLKNQSLVQAGSCSLIV